MILREGLASVAVRGLRDSDEHRAIEAFELFRHSAATAQMRAMAADAAGSSVLGALEESGINSTVVKGPAVARFHPESWPRTYVDIDVVVTSVTFEAAAKVVESLGYAFSDRSVPQREWFNRICREGVNLHSPQGGNIDLHHHVSPWALARRLTAADLIARSETIVWCGRSVRMASAGDLLLVSALHVLNDLWKAKAGLNSWRDIVALIELLGPDGARQSFAQVGLTGLYDVMASHLAVSAPALGLEPARYLELTTSERFQLASLGWTPAHWATSLRLAWAARLPPLNAVAYLAGTAVPSREYITERHETYRRYWGTALKEMWATTRGSDYRMVTVEGERDS